MNRRAFIQGLIGLASTPMIAKYINVFKPAAVREGITQAADNTMQKGIEFYEAVIKRVMDEGNIIGESNRVRTYRHPDKPDINVELNLTSGDTAVYFKTDAGSRAAAEISTDIEMGPRAPKELIESEEVYRMGQGNDYYTDIDEEIKSGVGSLEDWIKMKRGYAAGGRVGMFRGGVPKGLAAALRAIRSKFGDDSIKTVTETDEFSGLPVANIDTPEKSIIRNKIQNFGKKGRFNEDGTIDYEYYAENLNDAENTFVYGDETIEELESMLKEQKDYEAAMFADYKAGKLDKYAPSLADEVNDAQIRAAVDDIFPTGDYKYDASMAAEALVENNPQIFGNKLYEDLDQRTQSKIYGLVVEVVMGDQAKMLQMKRLSKPTKTLEGIENTGTINISDPNVAEEFARFMRETDPKGAKKVDEIVELTNFNPKGRKKNAKGGHIKDDADVSLTIIEIPDISQSGVESLFKRR